MAKSDTFFIRASITPDDSATYIQNTIELGAFVDALGKSVLRIVNIEGEWAQATDGAIPNATVKGANNEYATNINQLNIQRTRSTGRSSIFHISVNWIYQYAILTYVQYHTISLITIG